MANKPGTIVIRLSWRFVWRMAGATSIVLHVGRRAIRLPRWVCAAVVWWQLRKDFPKRVELYAMRDLIGK